jgi:flavin-dependent dehydrogenase
MHVVIVGGGISGLSLALSLHQKSQPRPRNRAAACRGACPDGLGAIEDVLTREELEGTALNFKKAAGLDVETVNARDSIVDLSALAQ